MGTEPRAYHDEWMSATEPEPFFHTHCQYCAEYNIIIDNVFTHLEFWIIVHKDCDHADTWNISVHNKALQHADTLLYTL